jgi:protein SCO1/2
MKNVIAIVINLALVILLEACESKRNPLPYYGETEIVSVQQADGSHNEQLRYMPVPKFLLTNQDSLPIKRSDFEGKVTIVDFFFTECPSICPMLTSQMARLQKEFDNAGLREKIQFVSISVKPSSDSPKTLRAYAERLGADLRNWTFLTGREEDIYPLAEKGFFLTAFPSDSAQGGVFHTDQVTLLDSEMKIRGYYEGTSTKAMDSLFIDAKDLITSLNHP